MRGRPFFLVFLIVFFTINVVFGESFYVTNPDEFQNALTIADSNEEDDVINVAAATYNITSTLTYFTNDGDSGHKLTIHGAGADKTVLDGGGSVQILYINTDPDCNHDDGGDVTIEGMAFKNGYGGVAVRGNSINITIKECIFSENSGYHGGVHAYSYTGTVTITNNTFSKNSAILAGGGVDVTSRHSTITIRNNAFLKNLAGLSDGGGVQAWSESGTIIIANNTFSGNSGRVGGGVSAEVDSGTIIITNNTFSGNSARRGYGADGGGVYASSYYGPITILNNTFSKNLGYFGGGVFARLYTDSPTLDELRIFGVQ